MSCLFFSPQHREVDESCSLLISGQTAKKVKERNLVVFYDRRLRSLAAIADLLALDDDGSAVIRFGKGEDVVVGKAHTLSDLIRDGNSASFAKDSI